MHRQLYFPIITLSMVFGLWGCSTAKKAQSMIDPAILNGRWVLTELTGATVSLDVLYPEKKPAIQFDSANQKISGNTGCNSFNGPLKVTGAQIDLSSPMAMTRMFCPGDGEKMFLDAFTTSNGWTVRDTELRLMKNDLLVMKFEKADTK